MKPIGLPLLLSIYKKIYRYGKFPLVNFVLLESFYFSSISTSLKLKVYMTPLLSYTKCQKFISMKVADVSEYWIFPNTYNLHNGLN